MSHLPLLPGEDAMIRLGARLEVLIVKYPRTNHLGKPTGRTQKVYYLCEVTCKLGPNLTDCNTILSKLRCVVPKEAMQCSTWKPPLLRPAHVFHNYREFFPNAV